MPKLFTIDSGIVSIASDAIDDLIDQLGKPCKVVYEPTKTQCNNCYLDTTTDKSSGKYNGTGPVSFTRGKCPVCDGLGYLPDEVENFDIVTLLINTTPKAYKMYDPSVKIPQGLIGAKGYVTDLPKVLTAKTIIVDYQHVVDVSARYVLWGEPAQTGNIVKNRYFEFYMQRFGS